MDLLSHWFAGFVGFCMGWLLSHYIEEQRQGPLYFFSDTRDDQRWHDVGSWRFPSVQSAWAHARVIWEYTDPTRGVQFDTGSRTFFCWLPKQGQNHDNL
jgi:hypothetical protein